MSQKRAFVATILSVMLCSSILCEEMKFSYSLPDRQNICFFQNLAENIQGKKILIAV